MSAASQFQRSGQPARTLRRLRRTATFRKRWWRRSKSWKCAYDAAKADPSFQNANSTRSCANFAGRPTPLQFRAAR